MEQNPKQQVVERLRQANNILVTVSANPTVDQLASCIGTTLMLNKLGKHATAIFSGKVPSTLEFLEPGKTLEPNTDSLRDFIIALDKSKADKLRYKLEDNMVKIFITPYRTSISEKDLDFSQGDFNVEVVLALGVTNKNDIDQAISGHGRILHDATVFSVTSGQVSSDIGSINWQDPTSSSLCEMIVSISESFQSGIIDAQMATAFLTGIVSETSRFSNSRTSPKVMTMSAQLMAAGANQQLIANKLEEPKPIPAQSPVPLGNPPDQLPPVETEAPKRIEPIEAVAPEVHEESIVDKIIDHKESDATQLDILHNDVGDVTDTNRIEEINIDEKGNLHKLSEAPTTDSQSVLPPSQTEGRHLTNQPPLGTPQADTSEDEDGAPNTDPLVSQTPISEPPRDNGTLTEIEESVHSPHLGASESFGQGSVSSPDTSHVDSARMAVEQANNASDQGNLEPIQSLNAQPMNFGEAPATPVQPGSAPIPDIDTVNKPSEQSAPQVVDPNAPPPVPPPMMPPPNQVSNPYVNPG